VGLGQGATAPPPHPGQVILSAQDRPCSLSLLLLCSHACTHLFFLSSLLGEWKWVEVNTMYGWQLWMCSGPFLWISLTVAGITAVPKESGGMGWCPHVCAAFPSSPCGGGVRMCVWCLRRLVSALAPTGSVLWPSTPPPMHSVCIHFSSHFFFWGVAEGCGCHCTAGGSGSGCQLGSSHGLP
jgi:hypothetical protein